MLSAGLREPLLPRAREYTLGDWLFGGVVSEWFESRRTLQRTDFPTLPAEDSLPCNEIRWTGSLLKAVIGRHAKDLVWIFCLSLPMLLVTILRVAYLSYFLDYWQSNSGAGEGVFSAVAMCCIFTCAVFLSLYTSSFASRVKVRIHAASLRLLHDKLLRTSLRTDCRQVLSLAQVDLQRVCNSVLVLPTAALHALQIAAVVTYFAVTSPVECWLLAGVCVCGAALLTAVMRTTNAKLTAMTKCLETRVSALSEALSCIHFVKLHCLETFFSNRLARLRTSELSQLRGMLVRFSLSLFLGLYLQIGAFLVLILYRYSADQVPTAKSVFVTASLVAIFCSPFMGLIGCVAGVLQALDAAKRVDVRPMQAFLELEEVQRREGCDSEAGSVELQDAVFGYEGLPLLNVSSLTIAPGELVAVVGASGAGKSALLHSLLGELRLLAGKACVSGSLAYSSGTDCYLAATTVRENILFSAPFSPRRYADVLENCALAGDLQQLPKGDLTELRERGANLSGGQRARVALARAAYRDCDIYVLDDPLASVDATAAEDILQRCVLCALAGKTRIIVTHSERVVKVADRVLVVENGKIVLNSPGQKSAGSIRAAKTQSEPLGHPAAGGATKEDAPRSVRLEPLLRYWKYAGGWSLSAVLFCVLTVYIVTGVATSLTLKSWSESLDSGASIFHYFVLLQCAIVLMIFLIFCTCFAFFLRASESIHSDALQCLFGAHLRSYFDSTPRQTILNVFSSDLNKVDLMLPVSIAHCVLVICYVLHSLATVAYLAPWSSALFVAMIGLLAYISAVGVSLSQAVTHLVQAGRSQVLSAFTEAQLGLATIRCFRTQASALASLHCGVDRFHRALVASLVTENWLEGRLSLLNTAVLGTLVVALVMARTAFSQADVGLVLTEVFPLAVSLGDVVKAVAMVVGEAVSLERVFNLLQ